MTQDRNRETIRRLFEEYLSGGREILDELVSPEFVNGFNGIRGPAGMAAGRAFLFTTFAEPEIVLDGIVADDRMAAARWHLRGRQRAPFRGSPPGQGVVEVSQISMYRLEDGKIVASWIEASPPRPVAT